MDFEIRKVRTAQGRRRLVNEREEYLLLIDQGLSSREACRRVGINSRTGKRWRNGPQPVGQEQSGTTGECGGAASWSVPIPA